MIREVMGIVGSSMLAVAPAPQVNFEGVIQRGQSSIAYLRKEEGLPINEQVPGLAIEVDRLGLVAGAAVRRHEAQRKGRYLGNNRHKGWLKVL